MNEIENIPVANGRQHDQRAVVDLILIVSAFTVVIFVMTSVRYMSFLALNWDLGINMQMLWTTTHGYLLFESADYQTSGVMSFLQVNQVYIALPMAYIYRLLPNAFTLFFVQAFVLSLSAVPIYFYAKTRIGSVRISMLVAIIFLSNFAVMSGVFYDFHWEAFMPLELFTFIYFFSKKRYLYSAVTLLIGCLSLQVFPFLAASYLLYAIVFPSETQPEQTSSCAKTQSARIHAAVFLVVTAVLYYLISYSGDHWIPALIGAQKAATATSTNSLAFLVNFGLTPSTIAGSLGYWGLMFAVLGFVPLLRVRSLIVIVPWFYFSVVAYPEHYSSQFGLQYGILAMAVLLVPFIEGLKSLKGSDIETDWLKRQIVTVGGLSLVAVPILYGFINVFYGLTNLIEFLATVAVLVIVVYNLYRLGLANKHHLPMIRIARSGKKDLIFYLVFIMIVGVMIGPLNPLNESPPFTGGYAVSFYPSSSYQYIGEISSAVGHNSTVLTTDNLFPFVANNPSAYSFYWYLTNYSDNQYFPYGASNLPQYLLLSTSEMFTVPHFFLNEISNTSDYGLRIMIANTMYPGDIYLYEMNYSAPTLIYQA